jgi:hypothetical protein
MAKRVDAVDLDADLLKLIGGAGVRIVCDWMAATSLWTNPEVYRQVQVIHPQTRRLSGSEVFRSEVSGLIVWRNEPAASAFWKAYGVSLGGSSPRSFKSAHLCHIYEKSAHHPEHYTNLANLVAVPGALDSFTEWKPIRDLLKWRSFELYGYRGPSGESPPKPPYVPEHWPGVKALTAAEVAATVERLRRLQFEQPGYIPRRRTTTPISK